MNSPSALCFFRLPRKSAYYSLMYWIALLVFFTGTAIFSYIILPALLLKTALKKYSPADRIFAVRSLLQKGCSVFLSFTEFLNVTAIKVERKQNGTAILVANHPTIFDALIFIAQEPGICCIAKPSLLTSFFFRPVIRSAGYITDKDPVALLYGASEELRLGRSILIFPEGTRSSGIRPGRFKRGAARLAIETNIPVIPVIISCNPPVLQRHHGWFEFFEKTCSISVRYCSQLTSDNMKEIADTSEPGLASRRITEYIEELFSNNSREN